MSKRIQEATNFAIRAAHAGVTHGLQTSNVEASLK